MYTTQEIHKLNKYLFFRNHSGVVGQMIRLNEELLIKELGVLGNLFNAEYKTLHKLAMPSWIKSLWKIYSHAPGATQYAFSSIITNQKR